MVGNYPKTIDPWEVILYEHPNYAGMWIRYKMEPGMRQKLVPQIHPEMEDKVSSIQVGSMVGVIGFANPSFNQDWHKSYYLSTKSSLPEMKNQNELVLNDMISSLIIFPSAGHPVGVWLIDSIPIKTSAIRAFFPLPEQENVNEIEYPDLSQFGLDKNTDWLFSDYLSVGITLYDERNFNGTQLTLPGAGGWESKYTAGFAFASNLRDYAWGDRAASIRISWTGLPLNLGPPTPPKIEPPPVINLAGTWQSSIGAVYEITQEGNQFTWFAAKFNQTGKGYINEKNVAASWSDKEVTGSATGEITKTDAQGRATEIRWSNGVVFTRN
jgi:hypothetical protein